VTQTPTPAGQEKIYLLGTGGFPNYGDEYITQAWLQFLGQTRPSAEVWLDTPFPGQAVHLFSHLHPRIRFTDTLWRVLWDTADMEREEADRLLDERLAHLGTPRYDLGIIRMKEATTFHILGGGYINSVWPLHVGLLRAAQRLRELTGIRIAATGLGLTPATGVATLQEAVKHFDHFSVRDQPSAELVGGDVGLDDAFLTLPQLPAYRRGAGSEGAQDVWVCLQSDLGRPELFESMVESARRLLTSPELEGRTVRYAEAIPGVDRAAFDRLSDLIPEENFVPFLQFWERDFPGAAGQVWITSRFHLHLLAAASGARGVALEINEDYYRTKHQSLLDLGTGWPVVKAGTVEAPTPALSGEFPRQAKQLAQTKWREAQVVYPRRR